MSRSIKFIYKKIRAPFHPHPQEKPYFYKNLRRIRKQGEKLMPNGIKLNNSFYHSFMTYLQFVLKSFLNFILDQQ